MIKVIYFDIGGVLITDEIDSAARIFSKRLGISQERIKEAFRKTKDWRYYAGIITNERWSNMFKELSINGIDVADFAQEWQSTQVPISKTLEIVDKLKNKYRLGVLSDQGKYMSEHLKKNRILDLFSIRLISSEIGHSKDEPKTPIYDIAIEKANVAPEEILLIDNRQEHLDAASKKGIQVLLFTNPDDLKESLEARKLI